MINTTNLLLAVRVGIADLRGAGPGRVGGGGALEDDHDDEEEAEEQLKKVAQERELVTSLRVELAELQTDTEMVSTQ